eukprot:Lankesteria_metandrocarpae@DN922_c0_g1_i1.p1
MACVNGWLKEAESWLQSVSPKRPRNTGRSAELEKIITADPRDRELVEATSVVWYNNFKAPAFRTATIMFLKLPNGVRIRLQATEKTNYRASIIYEASMRLGKRGPCCSVVQYYYSVLECSSAANTTRRVLEQGVQDNAHGN